MSRYQAYPEYTESGEPWLGKIPSGWAVVPLKRVATLKTGLTPPTENQDNYEDDETEFSWVRPEDLNENGQAVNASKFLSASGWSLMRHIPAFSTLVCCIGTIGKLGYVERIVTTNQQITAASFTYAPKFNFYLLQSVRNILEQTATGNVIQILNSERLSNVKFLSLPKAEAETIANFLDHETAKIDTLIEKQQQLIQLLKEKRQAVISHAVTKGLNPNAPMKDSGVEWLGEVPEGWEVTRAKYVSEIFVPQRNKPELNELSGTAWATMEDMKNSYIESTKNFVSEDAARFSGSKKLAAGSVIASCVGNFGIASINLVDVIINQQLQAFMPKKIKAEFLREVISISKSYFELIGTAATLVYVNQQGFDNLPVVVPPASEQDDICSFTEGQSLKFNTLIKKSDGAIDLIQERRTALISAAVTGKIDVRNFVSEAGQAPDANTRVVAV